MFTGIVEELGTVVSRARGPGCASAATTVLDDVEHGRIDRRQRHLPHRRRLGRRRGWWEADVVDETYDRTALGALAGRATG